MTDERSDALWFTREFDDPPTLGARLEEERARRAWSRKQMAMALSMSYEKYMRIKADVDLPTEEELGNAAHLFGVVMSHFERNLRATIHTILRKTIDAVARPSTTLRAARRRGPDVGDAETAMMDDLPAALRQVLAQHFNVAGDDARGLVIALRGISAEAPEEQRRRVRLLASQVELEGRPAELEGPFAALLEEPFDDLLEE